MGNVGDIRRSERRIRAIFFDFDGVLTRDSTGSITTLRYLSKATGIEFGRLEAAFSEHNVALNLGRTTYAAIWPAVCNKLGCLIDISLLAAAFESTPLNAEMLELARNLRKNYFTGIITDNKRDRMNHLKACAGLSSIFDPIVVSAEVGYDKRGTEIFERALNLLDVAPEDSVFIDNASNNLKMADALRMNTIHFNDAKNDVQALASVLEESYGLKLRASPDVA